LETILMPIFFDAFLDLFCQHYIPV